MDLKIKNFNGYQLLDSGEGKKLERFSSIVMQRPCPQAIWPKKHKSLWKNCQAVFHRTESGSGHWAFSKGEGGDAFLAKIDMLSFEIRFTGFGNVGFFPEHTVHFDWMKSLVESLEKPAKVLNLFAYTGGASMICAQAGAVVTHVDAAKSVNGWAMHNGRLSNIKDGAIRYLADDALKFVKKELRRNNRYDAIIMDPPTYGRGSKGETWKIERDFDELVQNCKQLLSDNPLFMLVTSHSPGVSPRVLENLIKHKNNKIQSGEMLLFQKENPLPAGVYARWSSQ